MSCGISTSISHKQVISSAFTVSNGVKQGGVLFPVLFNKYLDVLLLKIRKSGHRYYIGSVFMGCFAYAHDVILVSPCYGINQTFDIADKYSQLYSLTFNTEETKVIVSDDCQDDINFLLSKKSKCEKHSQGC